MKRLLPAGNRGLCRGSTYIQARESRFAGLGFAGLAGGKSKGPGEAIPPALICLGLYGWAQKPPMPPMSGIAGIAGLSSGFSAIAASVVIRRPETEAASCRAMRTTLVGSITPAATRFS